MTLPPGHAHTQESRHVWEALQLHAAQPQCWGGPAGLASQTGTIAHP